MSSILLAATGSVGRVSSVLLAVDEDAVGIAKIMPNVVKYWDRMVKAIFETLQMVGFALPIITVFGILLGVCLVVISKGHIYENRILNETLPRIVNVMRSIPFVILIAVILPFTRFTVGTAVGVPGAVVPMVVALIPFVARQVELSLFEVDRGVIEMALSLGISKPYLIFHILLKEGRAGIIRSITLCSISLVSYSAMAGVVGGGGIGDLAIRYGYARFMTDITFFSVVLLLILVFGLQGIGNLLLKKLSY
jgi:D-methionine transport system permease protein